MPASDDWCTPPWLTARLPWVDLDPCSNAGSTVPAFVRLSLENGDDGLARPWAERNVWELPTNNDPPRNRRCLTAFVNPPYSNVTPWIRRAGEFLQSGGESLLLVKLDPTTKWWALAREFHAYPMTFRKRIRFAGAPSGANFPSALLWFRPPRFLNHTFDSFINGLTLEGHLW